MYAERAARGHRDSATVAVDVERCSWLGKVGLTEANKKLQAVALEKMINGVVCSHPGRMHYFQGNFPASPASAGSPLSCHLKRR